MADRTCPAGHRVKDPHAWRCPTCGRLMALRHARTCPNGHLVAGPGRVCPVCGAELGSHWPARAVGVVAVAALAVGTLVASAAQVPDRTIAWALSTWEALRDAVVALLPFEL